MTFGPDLCLPASKMGLQVEPCLEMINRIEEEKEKKERSNERRLEAVSIPRSSFPRGAVAFLFNSPSHARSAFCSLCILTTTSCRPPPQSLSCQPAEQPFFDLVPNRRIDPSAVDKASTQRPAAGSICQLLGEYDCVRDCFFEPDAVNGIRSGCLNRV